MSAERSLPLPKPSGIDSVLSIATKLTALGAACCSVWVVVTEGATLLAVWNLILPLSILWGFRVWTLISPSFRPVGMPALAFSIVAMATVFVPHIGLFPHELKLEGGNHLVALFMFLPIASTLSGVMALAVVFVIRFLIGHRRAMNPSHANRAETTMTKLRSNVADANHGTHDTCRVIDAARTPSPDPKR